MRTPDATRKLETVPFPAATVSRRFGVALAMWRSVPEGRFRNFLRSIGYRLRVGLPRELQINPDDTVVQVGMWRTASLIRLARSVGECGRAIVIEASPDHAAAGQRLFAELGIANVEILNVGAWKSPGTMEVKKSKDPSGFQLSEAQALSPEEFTGESFDIPIERVDDICSRLGVTRVDYLEITVNGVELEVLEGCGDLLQRVDRVFVAGMMRDPETKQPLNKKVADRLEAAGFRTQISRRGRKLTEEWGRVDGHVFGWRH